MKKSDLIEKVADILQEALVGASPENIEKILKGSWLKMAKKRGVKHVIPSESGGFDQLRNAIELPLSRVKSTPKPVILKNKETSRVFAHELDEAKYSHGPSANKYPVNSRMGYGPSENHADIRVIENETNMAKKLKGAGYSDYHLAARMSGGGFNQMVGEGHPRNLKAYEKYNSVAKDILHNRRLEYEAGVSARQAKAKAWEEKAKAILERRKLNSGAKND